MAHVHVMDALKIVTHECVKAIDVIGANEIQLKNVIIVKPELNDCSGFEGIDEHCMSAYITLLF